VPPRPSRTDPSNREPATAVESPRIAPMNHAPAVQFESSRIDPLNREPATKPGSTALFKPSRIDPLNREPGAFPDPEPRPIHRIQEPAPRIHAMRRTRGASAAGKKSLSKKSLPRMNADKLLSRPRDWLNARVSHRHICVHLRLFAAKILFFLITQPQPDAPEKAQALRARTRRQNPAQPRRSNHPVQIL